jgi:hypothetical protein
MGVVTKKILGDHKKDPLYESFTIEDNKNNIVHMHIKNVRLDLTHDAYNSLYNGLVEAMEKLSNKKR